MGFQKGNKLGTGRPVSKPFYDALMMEIKGAGSDHKSLRRIARKLMACAESGESWAIREIADRLDGKPHQTVDKTVEHKKTIHEITDDELIAIATAGSTNGTGKANGKGKPH